MKIQHYLKGLLLLLLFKERVEIGCHGFRKLKSEKSEERSKTILSEKTIPEHELKRWRNLALRMKERLKVGSTGVTQSLVDATHEKWKIDEVVKLKFESQSRFNMKRIHDVLEVGLLFWIIFLPLCILICVSWLMIYQYHYSAFSFLKVMLGLGTIFIEIIKVKLKKYDF